MLIRKPFCSFLVVFFLLATPDAVRQTSAADTDDDDVLAGHSFHGETFNEGPRQSAYLMAGLSGVSFPATANTQAQRFIDQGVAQLHGFWYYESERSFRQASVFDPNCAISYWGMAMANVENRKRGQGFIAEAMSRKDSCSAREKLYIEALNQFYKDKDDKGKKTSKKDRAQRYTRDLEKIVLEHPDDIEARAFLALQLYHNARADLPIVSHIAVDSILQDVFDANPSHPAHHYRIHLWDRHDPSQALKSAASCGQSLPAIAHMWHMPGHIYSRLHRYNDAAWQQEASARVDHAHMMRDRVLPDQIHNFAHNNEWLIRNLIKVGRVDDAIDLAKNMLELPRHPKYNSLSRGSAKYGRERLILVLKTYRLWDQLLTYCSSQYLPDSDDEKRDLQRQTLIGFAAAMTGNDNVYQKTSGDLSSQLAKIQDKLTELEDASKESDEDQTKKKKETENEAEATAKETPDAPADEKADTGNTAESEPEEVELSGADRKKAAANRQREKKKREAESKKLREKEKTLKSAIAKLKAAAAAQAGEYETALTNWKTGGLKDELLHAEWLAAAGKIDEARKLIDAQIEKLPGEVLPLAVATWIEDQHGEAEKANEHFKNLREHATAADLTTPLLARLDNVASECGFEGHWAAPLKLAGDIGTRPDLDSLGSFRWQPYIAPEFDVESATNKQFGSADIDGQATMVIFYLGFGCLHCVEQLHAFSPKMEEFSQAGINIVAISSETVESLNEGLADFGKPLHIPLHSDPEMDAFKSFRCYDDFESQPLHGTFLIDTSGTVLWQDISYEPFMDVDFALEEGKRLLNLHQPEQVVSEQATPSGGAQ